METSAESSPEEKPSPPPPADFPLKIKAKTVEEVTPWIDYAAQQALIYKTTMQETLDATINASRSRFPQILSTASAHSLMTIDYVKDFFKSEVVVYEDKLLGKVKEGVNVAASHPFIAAGVATGLGFVVLKRPRRFFYHKSLRLFVSEETLLSQADSRVKELRHSISKLQAESEKLERRASSAEEELIRGRTKIRQAGKQIQGVICSAYKIEREAAVGLKDVLRELPGRESSRFRSQVSSLDSEAKQERKALTKEVRKISNYGISV